MPTRFRVGYRSIPDRQDRRQQRHLGNDAGTAQQSLAWRNFGGDPAPTRCPLRLARIGQADRYPLLQPRAEHQLQPQIPSAYALGAGASRIALSLHAAFVAALSPANY